MGDAKPVEGRHGRWVKTCASRDGLKGDKVAERCPRWKGCSTMGKGKVGAN